MNKPKFETPNLTADNMAKLAELFPGVVTEGKVNIDLLRSLVGEEVFGDEAYEFTWVGKRDAIAEAGRPIRKTLRPCVEESKDWDTTENLHIEGDNLDVLKLLRESYLGKVKMIYIDPPYNTGSDRFVYRDKFAMSSSDYEEIAEMYDDAGDLNYRENSRTNPRFHSRWCSEMYAVLTLTRNMLSVDGVIFIHIDDREAAQLRKICDEIIGESNYLAEFPRVTKKSGKSSDVTAKNHDYILLYAKNAIQSNLIGVSHNNSEYNNQDEFFEQRGFYKLNQTIHSDIHRR